MVEKVNDIIKLNTLKIHTYENIWEMKTDLNSFLLNYNLTRRHSSLRTEIWVKTPFEAIEFYLKQWVISHTPRELPLGHILI